MKLRVIIDHLPEMDTDFGIGLAFSGHYQMQVRVVGWEDQVFANIFDGNRFVHFPTIRRPYMAAG